VNTIDVDALIHTLEREFNQARIRQDAIQNEVVIEIPAEKLYQVSSLLLNQFDLYHLTTITAQQRADDTDYLEVQYNFWKKGGFTILTRLDQESPVLRSLTDLIPGADFYEREVAEMFGIQFTHRVETPPLLLPDDWDADPPMLQREESL
jgi:NADH-quinone oxidoreductase subunit C